MKRRALSLPLLLLALVVTGVGEGRAEADEPTENEDALAPTGPAAAEAPPSTFGNSGRFVMFEAAARAGYLSTPIRGGVNPFGTSLGARAGVDVGPLYLGASLLDCMGGSDNGATDQTLLPGIEVGYNARINGYFTLRPMVGVGDAILTHTEPGTPGAVGSAPDVVTSASGTVTSEGGTGGTSGTSPTTTTVKNIYVQPSLSAVFTYRHFFGALTFGALVVPGIVYGPAPAETTTWISYSFESSLGFRL